MELLDPSWSQIGFLEVSRFLEVSNFGADRDTPIVLTPHAYDRQSPCAKNCTQLGAPLQAQIDALRALAVTGALHVHFGGEHSSLGRLCVHLFFVVGCNLITEILLQCGSSIEDKRPIGHRSGGEICAAVS